MKHAGPVDLSHLHDLLAGLRVMPGMEEMIQGIYHHGGVAILHFHASSAGCFADLRDGDDWKRYPVNTPEERAAVLGYLQAALPTAKVAGPQPAGHQRTIAHGMKLEPRARPRRPKPARSKRHASVKKQT